MKKTQRPHESDQQVPGTIAVLEAKQETGVFSGKRCHQTCSYGIINSQKKRVFDTVKDQVS